MNSDNYHRLTFTRCFTSSSPARLDWQRASLMTETQRRGLVAILETNEEIIQSFGFSTVHQAVLGLLPRSLLESPSVIKPDLNIANA